MNSIVLVYSMNIQLYMYEAFKCIFLTFFIKLLFWILLMKTDPKQ